jgi:uncharacterized membrane protein YeaQ/YmgE (transglycosylase-associated protein family)
MKGILVGAGVLAGAWLLFNLLGALLVGFLARAVFPAKDRVGWGMTLLVGFLGGLVGKILFFMFGIGTKGLMGFVASVVGAFVLLLLYHFWRAAKTKSAPAT